MFRTTILVCAVIFAAQATPALAQSCDAVTAEQKLNEIIALVNELVTADPAKLASVQPRMEEIQAALAGNEGNQEISCQVLDEIIEELSRR